MPARNPQDAARRLLCLMSQGARGYFEGELTTGNAADPVDAREQIDALLDWLRSEGLWPHLSAREGAVMTKPTGRWTHRDQINAGWRTESAGVIAWSLRLLDNIPPYDREFRPLHIMDVIPQTGESTNDFIRAAAFRFEDEIEEARQLAELWLWRSRTQRHLVNPETGSGTTTPEQYAQYVLESAANREQEGQFKAIDGDYPAFGKAYRDLSPDEHQRANSIAQERLWGLNWLCDEEADWDQVDLST